MSNADIVRKLKPSVVYIDTGKSSGSGMIIDGAGHVLTNAHVVEGTKTAQVKLSTGTSYSATVTGKNKEIDLAVLKIDGGSGFSPVEFGNSDGASQGDSVYAFGFPFGFKEDVSFTEGVYSRSLMHDDIMYMEISANIHPGNSGGPLVDRQGRVIGVNSNVYGFLVGGVAIGETIKFSLPINTAQKHIASLKGVTYASQECQTLGNMMTAFTDWYEEFEGATKEALEYIEVPTTDLYSYPFLKERIPKYNEMLELAEAKVRNSPTVLYTLGYDVSSLKTDMLRVTASLKTLGTKELDLSYVKQENKRNELVYAFEAVAAETKKFEAYKATAKENLLAIENKYKAQLSVQGCK